MGTADWRTTTIIIIIIITVIKTPPMVLHTADAIVVTTTMVRHFVCCGCLLRLCQRTVVLLQLLCASPMLMISTAMFGGCRRNTTTTTTPTTTVATGPVELPGIRLQPTAVRVRVTSGHFAEGHPVGLHACKGTKDQRFERVTGHRNAAQNTRYEVPSLRLIWLCSFVLWKLLSAAAPWLSCSVLPEASTGPPISTLGLNCGTRSCVPVCACVCLCAPVYACV